MIGIAASNKRRSGAPPAGFTMVNVANTTVSDLGGDEWSITNAGSDGFGANSAKSTTSFAGDFILRFQPQQTNKHIMIGVNSDPDTSNHYNTIDFALYFNGGDSSVDLYQNGTGGGLGSTPSYTAGQNWFIKRSGTTLSFGYGGTDGVTGYTQVTTKTSSATLYVDSDMHTTGGVIYVKKVA